MSKIIIHNSSSLPDSKVLELVTSVIKGGRCSNEGKQYCYCTVFSHSKVAIISKLNKNSDAFYVEDQNEFR